MKHSIAGSLTFLLLLATAAPPSAAPALSAASALAGARSVPPAEAPRALGLASAPQLYSIGDPTDEEQLYLEKMNRSRANPIAEAGRLQAETDQAIIDNYDFFHIDLNFLAAQYAVIPAAPPLSFNAILISVARAHSQDMLENKFQDHYGFRGCPPNSPPCDPASAPGGITNLGCCLPFDRMTAAGYIWSRAAENVFAYAKSVEHGHASFEVDWGGTPATGGIQDPPGHRENIHNPNYREIGVGVILGSNGKFGPQLVTQDFGTTFEATPFITGVAYYDLNGNGFYDPGEGIGGIQVTIPGVAFYAITSNSGGYSIPVPADGNYAVNFSVPGAGVTQQTVTVAQAQNAKLDFVPLYPPPGITGGTDAYLTNHNLYTFTPVGGASAYQWQQTTRVNWVTPEGAETGAAGITALTTPGYPIITSDTSASGSFSFHLTNLPDIADDQTIVLNRNLYVGPGSELSFSSRLAAATTNQFIHAQISTDGGWSWQTVWQRTGKGRGQIGELTFTKQTVPLTAFGGSVIKVRFLYTNNGAYFIGADLGVGFYVDDIWVSHAEELTNPLTTDAGSNTNFAFTPPSAGNYTLRVRAQVSGRWLDFGPPLLVTGKAGVPVTQIIVDDFRFQGNSQIQLLFRILQGNTGDFHLESALTPAGPWSVDDTAVVQPTSSNTQFRILSFKIFARQRFYRVVVN